MVIEVLNVTLNLKHLFNNNVTILQSEKNPSQSHQSRHRKINVIFYYILTD